MQKITPVKVNLKEDGLGWIIDSFKIYKSTIYTNKAIMLLAFFSIMFTDYIVNSLPTELYPYLKWLEISSYKVLFCSYFIIYMIGIFYKHDKTSPEIKIDFSENVLKKFFKFNFIFFAIHMISYAIGYLFSIGESIENNKTVVEYNQIDLYMIGIKNYIFYYVFDFFIFSMIMIYIFMDKNLLSSIKAVYQAIFGKENLLTVLFITFTTISLVSFFSRIDNYVNLIYFVLFPYVISFYYVLFKHMFFGMKPSEVTFKKRVLSPSF